MAESDRPAGLMLCRGFEMVIIGYGTRSRKLTAACILTDYSIVSLFRVNPVKLRERVCFTRGLSAKYSMGAGGAGSRYEGLAEYY
jgi:hypothetical protein